MSIEYDNYLTEHRENVYKGMAWIQSNASHLLNESSWRYNHAVLTHDDSKYDMEEYDAYDQYFYGERRTKEVKDNFNYAWLHHIHNNPHHWQHWILINDEPGEGTIALRMPHKYVIEMICDWWAFSWKSGNLYGIFDWYDKHKAYMKLHADTRELVEDILNEIRAKLDEDKVGDGE